MANDHSRPSGPDLAQGIPFASLQESVPFAGHVGGEPVLMVRRGEEVLAVSGSCTHYGAPLADGIVVGDTIRCPWHHACFDLRTGQTQRPPALNPLACFQVRRSGDSVRVLERLPPAPRPPLTEAPESILIVGTGAAGNSAAETLRRQGYTGRLTMVGREADVPYDRPNLSKDYLAGTAPEEWIPLRSEAFYREQQIDLILCAPVVALDVAGRTATLADGRALAWDRLLLATGADPARLTIDGGQSARVRTLRSLADSRAIVAAVDRGMRVVVVGASFIGMEVAAALRTRGAEVHVIAPDAVPFERVLGAGVGDFLRGVHIEHGVTFTLGETVARIDDGMVTLAGGRTLHADLVVVGIGVRPAVELATAAGLTVDRGIVVDQFLQTSAKGVFAAGDVARWPDPRSGETMPAGPKAIGQTMRIEHWVVAQRMGMTAAHNMLAPMSGNPEPFDAVPFFWSVQYDVTLCYVGHAERWDRVDLDGSLEARDCAVAYRAGGKTLAVLTIGRDRTSLEAELALERADETRLSELVP